MVVDRLLEKMFLILSCNFLVLNFGVVNGVLTVVDLARPGGRLGKNSPGLRDGWKDDDDDDPEDDVVAPGSELDSVVVIPGVIPNLMVVVPR